MANQAASITVDVKNGSSIIQDGIIIVNVIYTGGTSTQITDIDSIKTQIISGKATISTSRYNNLDIKNNTLTSEYEIYANEDPNSEDIKVSFSSKIDSKLTTTSIFKSISQDKIFVPFFAPQILSSSFVEDFSPVDKKSTPSIKNPGVIINFHAVDINQNDLQYFQIPLTIDDNVRVFLIDNNNNLLDEVFSDIKNSSVFYLNTDVNGKLKIKIFPTNKILNKRVKLIVNFVNFSQVSANSDILFITNNISASRSPPIIEEMLGYNLSPTVNNLFHVTIPPYLSTRTNDRVYIMVRDNNTDYFCTTALIVLDGSLGTPFIPVSYNSIPNIGWNCLFYYIVDISGNVSKSSNLYFNLISKGPNKPADGIHRYVKPSFINDNNEEINVISKDTLLGKMNLQIKTNNNKNTVKKNDLISGFFYINATRKDNIIENKDTFPISEYLVTDTDVKTGIIKIPVNMDIFQEYESYEDGSPGVVYYQYSVGEDNSAVWQASIDTVAPGEWWLIPQQTH